MSVESFQEIPIEEFGGLVTILDPGDVPPGCSPNCQDVEFFPGGWRTRPGLLAAFQVVASIATFNGLKAYKTLALLQKLVAYTSDGSFMVGIPDGALTQVTTGLPSACWMESCTIDGAEYCCISDGTVGTWRPLQYNDATGFLDTVSQEGPGASPTAGDAAGVAYTIAAAAGSVSCTNNLVTLTLTTVPLASWVGHYITVTGVTDASFNTTNPVSITAVNPAAKTITYAFTHANGTSANGTATIGSSIIGLHQVAFFYVTRTGFWTHLSPAAQWNTAGSTQVTVTIPTGPPNVVARGVACTTAGGARFFHLEDRMLLQDNVSGTITFDVDDATLASGFSVDYLNLIEVAQPASHAIGYASRLFLVGERNHLQGFPNLSWMGGPGGAGAPWGWTGAVTTAMPVTLYNQSPMPACLQLLGAPAVANPTTITQPANVDPWLGVQLLQTYTSYTVRAWVRRDPGLLAGQLNINLTSAALGLTTIGLALAASGVTTGWAEYSGILVDGNSLTMNPADLLLQISTTLAPTAGQAFYLGAVSIYPTLEPKLGNGSRVRASNAGDFETFVGTTGALAIDENSDQDVRAAFVQREFLYLVKERSLHVTSDDGINEPSSWALEQVSPTVGTPSPRGVALGDSWAFIASRQGLNLFYGGRCRLLSSEIESLWQSANWDGAGQTVWITNNEKKRRVLVGLPMNGAAKPNFVLALYYNDLDDPLQCLLTDPLSNDGRGRHWAPWNVAACSGAVIESPTGPRDFVGNQVGNGKIYELSSAQRTDDGAAINDYYDTAFLGSPGFGRSLFGYLSMYVFGSGTLTLSANYPSYSRTLQLAKRTLQLVPANDAELPTNVLANRISFRLQTNAPGDWVECTKFVAYRKQDPWAPVKGR